MGTFLFHDIIFGPVRSRRLGQSLGINLMPTQKKVCNFDCIYCECGWSEESSFGHSLPEPSLVLQLLEEKLQRMLAEKSGLDVMTFAGNGEPTLHPDFPLIIKETLRLRDRFFPTANVAVLSNASKIDDPQVFQALLQVDQNILKLDAGSEAMCKLINKPAMDFDIAEKVQQLQKFDGRLIIQTLFLKGAVDGVDFDNSSNEEVSQWLQHISRIAPRSVMLYTLDRNTPQAGLEKISAARLQEIADQVEALGIETSIAT